MGIYFSLKTAKSMAAKSFKWGPVLGTCLLFMGANHAIADDGYYSIASSEYVYGSHVPVRMVRERVKVFVDMKEALKGDISPSATCICRFVFKNSGPATTVTMAFPENGSLHFEGDKSDQTQFLGFRSYVNGKKVSTRAHWSWKDKVFEHVKKVHFKANETLVVTDYFKETVSGQAMAPDGTNMSGALFFVPYLLGTGGSWKDMLDRAEIDLTEYNASKPLVLGQFPVQFDKKYTAPANGSGVGAEMLYLSDGNYGLPETVWVAWNGARTTVSGYTVQSVRTHFKPEKNETCWFFIGWRGAPKRQ